MRWIALLIAVLTSGTLPAIASESTSEVPPPSETPCDVIVNGRTSTLKNIVIRKTGQAVPKIYGGEKTAGNTPGFDWYVSQHYALKTEFKEEEARHFLTLAELAYPHYVEVIGREPPGIGTTRMAFVHARNLDRLQDAVRSDIGTHWAGNGGGVTLPADWVVYNYPSGGLRYHRNDLSIHENLHLLHCCVQGGMTTPHRFTEGITYLFSNHVYDPEKQQLTVAVFDKAPINNPIDSVLRQVAKDGPFSISDYLREKDPNPAVALWTAFFWSDPERLMKWRLWRDELLSRRLSGETLREFDLRTMHKLHGEALDGLEKDWAIWLKERHNTFTHVDWGWEQWGGTLQSYGWPWKKELFSQMDVHCSPGRELSPDPLRLDYPQPEPSPLVGEIRFGGDVPSVGCVVDFSKTNSSGWAGLGLGVQERDLFRAVIEGNRKLVLDGTRLKLQARRRDIDFTPDVLSAAQMNGGVGLTVRLKPGELEATVRAGSANDLKTMTASYPLTEDERRTLMTRHMALLSRDGKHWITPYLDAKVPAAQDLSKPGPANRWGFAADHETYRLYRAAWRLGSQSPSALLTLRDAMVQAMVQGSEAQQAAIRDYRARFPQVLKDVAAAGDPQAVAELSGLKLALRLSNPDAARTSILTAYLRNDGDRPLVGTVTFDLRPARDAGPNESLVFNVDPGCERSIEWPLSPKMFSPGPTQATVRATYSYQGFPTTLSTNMALQPGIPALWIAGPFDNKGDGQVDTPQAVEKEAFDAGQTFAGLGGKTIRWKRAERATTLPLLREHVVDLADLCGDLKNASAYALVWVNASESTAAMLACGSDDGLVIWLNDERVHASLKNRGYSRQEDRVPILLKKGANKLLFRVTQTWGGWSLGAEILDTDGRPITGLTYTLLPPSGK